MSKHTPGPWSLPHFAEPDVNCQCGYVLSADMFGAVCKVYASGDGDDWQAHGDNPKFAEAVANARLIAAAPAMLEAVKLHVAYEALPQDRGGKNGPKGRAWAAFIAARDAVLATAEVQP